MNLSVFRPTIEGDLSTGSCPHESTRRDPPLGKSFDGEPVLPSVGFKDGEKTVGQEEATSTLSNMQQGRSISSQAATTRV